MRRAKPFWGARRLALELARKGVQPAPSKSSICDGFTSALRTHGVPAQVLTDTGKVFTGRFTQPPVEVLFDRIGRENGVEHILTEPRSPTTTGKIERFHRTLRVEFDTTQVFRTLLTPSESLEPGPAGEPGGGSAD